MFLRYGDQVYRADSTTQREVDRWVSANNVVDLAAFGRQQFLEDPPAAGPGIRQAAEARRLVDWSGRS